MTQTVLFDQQQGEALKREALDAFEDKATGWLEYARAVARTLARDKGRLTADDVLAVTGMPVGIHHNVVGAIFSSREFLRVGFTKTARPKGHSRIISIWRLRSNNKIGGENGELSEGSLGLGIE